MLVLAFAITAEIVSCTARVALNRTYDISVDTESGALTGSNDAGTQYAGIAAKTLSGSTGNTTFFLPTGHGRGLELEIEAGGAQRIALCLAANECYICRR